MAKLTKMPSLAIINGFKGSIDYYVYMGLPCARKWPRSPGHKRAPDVEAQWPNFTNATKLWQRLSPEVQQTYIDLASSTTLRGFDWFMRGYLAGIFHKEPPP